MDDRALKYFEVVAKTRCIRTASDMLHVSPSAISRKISQLEEQLNICLMERLSRGVNLTESGLRLVQYIQDVNQRKNDFISELSEIDQLKSGTLRIATGGGFIPDLINNAITEFSKQHSGVKLVLDVGGGDYVIESLKNEESDIGLLLNSPVDPKIDILYSYPFQELSLLVPPDSKWAQLDICSPSQLCDVPLALLNQSFSIRQATNLYEAREEIRLNELMECNSFEALKCYVKSGLGGTLLPKTCVTRELQHKDFVAVAIEGMYSLDTSVDLVIRRGKAQSALIQKMKEYIVSSMDAFNVDD